MRQPLTATGSGPPIASTKKPYPDLTAFLWDFSLPGGDPARGVYCDAALSISHSRTAAVTMFPVEEGADISDHRRRGPVTVIVEGVLANNELATKANDALFASAFGLYEDAGETTQDEFTELRRQRWQEMSAPVGVHDRAAELYAELLQLWKSQETCSLVTPLDLYKTGVLESIDTREGPEAGDAVLFVATFREIFFAATESAVIVEPETAGKPAKQTKTKQAQVTPKPETKDTRSLWAKFTDYVAE